MLLFALADFSPIKPDFGLLLWTTVFFLLFWLIIGKFAFRPIAEALKKRHNDIQDALDEAKKAKEQMAMMQAENESLLAEAREERAKIIKEAKDASNQMINDAKSKAKEEAQKIVVSSKIEIENQKKSALTEVKNEVGAMAVNIAERILKNELAGESSNKSFVDNLVKELDFNQN